MEMKGVMWVAGIDAGRSAVKAVAYSLLKPDEVAEVTFPNFCIETPQISDAMTLRVIGEDRVMIGSADYLVGYSAETLGAASATPIGMDDSWFFSPQHAAMLVVAMRKLRANNPSFDPASGLVTLGLPAAMAIDEERKGHYLESVLRFFREAKLPNVQLGVSSQARGPLMDACMTNMGKESGSGFLTGTRAVVEVGHYSTDCIVLRNGLVLDSEQMSLPGMRVAAEQVAQALRQKGVSATVPRIRAVIEQGQYRTEGADVDATSLRDVAVREMASRLQRELSPMLQPHADDLEGLIFAGGGANLLEPYLKGLFPRMIVPNNPRFAVARGFAKNSALRAAT